MSKEAEGIVSDDRNEKDENDSYYDIDDLGLDIPDVNGSYELETDTDEFPNETPINSERQLTVRDVGGTKYLHTR